MKKKRKVLKIVLLSVSALLLGTIIYGVIFITDSLNYKDNLAVHRTSKPAAVLADNSAKPLSSENDNDTGFDSPYTINVALLGIDRTDERDKTLGIYRTDTIAIARIDMQNKKVKVLSIPRDTYTFVPVENKKDKINHAYAYGSAKGTPIESSIEAINNFLKYSSIDYYFSIDMEPIPEIVDYIGGVEIDVDVDMKDHGANLSKGLQVLNGQKAFDYIHWRYSNNGDIGRIQRQQKFASAMLKKIKNDGTLPETVHLVMSYSKDVKTNLTLKQLIGMAKLVSEIPGGNVEYSIIPGEDKIMNGIWYYIPDETQTDKILKDFFKE